MPRPAALLIALSLTVPGAAFGQTPVTPPKPAQQSAPALRQTDTFAEPVTMAEKTVIYVNGQGNWDSAFETLVAKFKQLNEFLDKQHIKPIGPAMTVYTQTDDTGFSFQAQIPVAAAPKDMPPGEIAVGKSPTGKALKFVHRGSFDTMDSTYEAITNHLDEKGLEAKDLFIEEYVSTPLSASETKLVVNVYVPIK